MSVEERHLLNKIRFFEDMLLRSKDYRQQENLILLSSLLSIQILRNRRRRNPKSFRNL